MLKDYIGQGATYKSKVMNRVLFLEHLQKWLCLTANQNFISHRFIIAGIF